MDAHAQELIQISRRRTIREFVFAKLLAPSLAGFFWFSVMGGTALFLENGGPGGIIGPTLEDEARSLFAMLELFPWSGIMSVLGALVIVIFFVTSSDFGSLVDVMVTSGGHPDPPSAYRIFWCVAEGVVAATLLVAGGLTALRTASLTPAAGHGGRRREWTRLGEFRNEDFGDSVFFHRPFDR